MSETLGPKEAHNAVAGMVEMYSGMVRDYERNFLLARQQIGQLDAALKESTAKLEATNKERIELVDQVDTLQKQIAEVHKTIGELAGNATDKINALTEGKEEIKCSARRTAERHNSLTAYLSNDPEGARLLIAWTNKRAESGFTEIEIEDSRSPEPTDAELDDAFSPKAKDGIQVVVQDGKGEEAHIKDMVCFKCPKHATRTHAGEYLCDDHAPQKSYIPEESPGP